MTNVDLYATNQMTREQMKQAMEEQVRLKEAARQQLRQEERTFDQYNQHIGK